MTTRISWLDDASIAPIPGLLGLTSLPGGSSPLDHDLDFIASKGVGLLVCLVEPFELNRQEPPETIQERAQAVERHGMSFLHEPIEDFKAPTQPQAQRLVAAICDHLERNSAVVMHCWAGLGRAGTIAACVLVRYGLTPQDAISTVRYFRPGAVQSRLQEEFVHAFKLSTP